MKNKFIFNEKLCDARMVFGSGVSTFLDHARKFLYLIPDAKLFSIRVRHHQIGTLRFQISSDTWKEYKYAHLQKDSMILSHTSGDQLFCYKLKILLSMSISNKATCVVILEDINQNHHSDYWNAFLDRYNNIDDPKNVKETYFTIEHF